MKVDFTNSAKLYIDESLEKCSGSTESVALAIYAIRSVGWGATKITVNVDLIQLNDEIKARFQEIDKFKNGSNLELPVLIDEKATQMLSHHKEITIDAFGWSFFRKLGIVDRPVKYLRGQC